MSRLLGLRRKPQCFYCQHVLEKTPSDPCIFECPSCMNMNYYDRQTGEILSSEPAMYDPEANKKSFSRRATPSRSTLPTAVEQSIFCKGCTVNQALVTNMLANYLPPQTDPSYAALLQTLPEYKSSLETRYPIVCEQCMPLVEEKLLKKETMARSKALNGWLNANSRHGPPGRPGIKNRVSSAVRPPKEQPWQTSLWVLQGILYIFTTAWIMISYFYGMSRTKSTFIRPPNPIIIVSSLLWTFWNRIWYPVRKAQARGHAVRAVGQKESMRIQFVLWLSRLVMSTLTSLWGAKVTEGTFGAFLAIEVALGVLSMITIKAQEPPPISLSRHNSTSFKETTLKHRPSAVPTDSFLAVKKKIPQPTFGARSLGGSLGTASSTVEEMDWSPQIGSLSSAPDLLLPKSSTSESTGLESLLAGTSLLGEPTSAQARAAHDASKPDTPELLKWIRRQDVFVMSGVTVAIIVLLLSAILPAWQVQQSGLWDPSWDWTHFETSEATGPLSVPTPEVWDPSDTH